MEVEWGLFNNTSLVTVLCYLFRVVQFLEIRLYDIVLCHFQFYSSIENLALDIHYMAESFLLHTSSDSCYIQIFSPPIYFLIFMHVDITHTACLFHFFLVVANLLHQTPLQHHTLCMSSIQSNFTLIEKYFVVSRWNILNCFSVSFLTWQLCFWNICLCC